MIEMVPLELCKPRHVTGPVLLQVVLGAMQLGVEDRVKCKHRQRGDQAAERVWAAGEKPDDESAPDRQTIEQMVVHREIDVGK